MAEAAPDGDGGRYALSLCLYAALGGALLGAIPGDAWELRWTHSVEKVEWREVWREAPGGLLQLARAHVKGAGAGMEPGPASRLIDGWWVWAPDAPPQPAVTLAASSYTAEHRLCAAGGDCRRLSEWAGGASDTALTLKVCP